MSDQQHSAPFDKLMIIRTIILLIAWLNQFLVMKGYTPLPIDNEELQYLLHLLWPLLHRSGPGGKIMMFVTKQDVIPSF